MPPRPSSPRISKPGGAGGGQYDGGRAVGEPPAVASSGSLAVGVMAADGGASPVAGGADWVLSGSSGMAGLPRGQSSGIDPNRIVTDKVQGAKLFCDDMDSYHFAERKVAGRPFAEI